MKEGSKILLQSKRAFTLAELLVALVITGLVLAAAATLSSAMGAAEDVADDTAQKQAQLRFATLRISELIRHSLLICEQSGDDITIWKADDTPENGRMDVLELAYIEAGPKRDYLRILEFTSCPPWLRAQFRGEAEQLDSLQSWNKTTLASKCVEKYNTLIPECKNVAYSFDTSPPWTTRVCISFNLEEHNVDHDYQINAALDSSAQSLLDDTGEIIQADDDWL